MPLRSLRQNTSANQEPVVKPGLENMTPRTTKRQPVVSTLGVRTKMHQEPLDTESIFMDGATSRARLYDSPARGRRDADFHLLSEFQRDREIPGAVGGDSLVACPDSANVLRAGHHRELAVAHVKGGRARAAGG